MAEDDGKRALVAGLYAEHAEALLRFLLRLTHGDRQLAEDLVQETMLRAWRHVDNLPGEWEPRRRWLFIVARRLTIDVVRVRRNRPVESGAMDLARIPSERDAAEAVVAAQTVRRALPKLSRMHRTVLVALYHEGLTGPELAEALDVPVGTVKSRTHYALRALRRIVETG
ncbi:sigma-70 family RNA polymerase sigma factor [Catenuloplanes atrovinosus]|uniref:RNA polymerase sigma-70 factor (ECF subfamily) n=1 Tax=Catenuloplanes atrovinosus TaxID=137266 RepID=A0AAE4C9W6_9ACTN|nr:sigma-70 family RNA polymerase sigma factor [Catenuloplanes atrovinosus]MDR7276463.1 RNA polymerase sigma-70 factor (ECF subfamily) [Catenuloplanes atrovinosus]